MKKPIIDTEFQKLIPPLQTEELFQLEASILADGCRDALVLWNGILIDGHNRYGICQKHSIPYKTTSLKFKDRNEVKVWIIQNQFARRNISAYQRSILALQLEQYFRKKGKENLKTSTGGVRPQRSPTLVKAAPVDTQKEIAKIAGISHGSLAKVMVIQKQATKQQKDRLLSGEASINEIYLQVKGDGIIQQRQAKRTALEKIPIPDFPNNKYRCIVIDPPWEMRIIPDNGRHSLRGGFEYPSMSLEAIESLPIADLANKKGCHVFLWVTHARILDGFKLFEAWGVKYSCMLTWIKPKGYTPYSFMYNTEHVLFGRIGSLEVFKPGIKLSFEAAITRHSAKPDIFYEIVEQVSPTPRLELFSRKKRTGFDAWGNEV